MAVTGAAMVMFEVVGSFQAKRMIQDAEAQMNILNAITLNGLVGIMNAVNEITTQINGMVDATVPLAKEVANATIQFQKFMGETENLEGVKNEIIDMGAALGFTADKSLEAGAKMAQLKDIIGGESAVAAATEVGIKFALIGDMETQDAMQKMINLQQQTGFMYGGLSKDTIELMNAEDRANLVRGNTLKVLTQLNTVENNSAANMKNLTFVMNQFASQAHLTGESIANMAAQSAVLIEAGEEQGKAGRALRMIYARLGADTNGAASILHQFGVETKNATTGGLRPLSEILEDLTKVYPQLSKEQQQEVAQVVAGNDHYVRFLKLIENQTRAKQLASMAALGLSDAEEEVNVKLENQATQLKILEAELYNASASLGEAFIPAQMKAIKSQISFNKALETFYTQSGTRLENTFGMMVGRIVDLAFHFERVQKVIGPVFQAFLNIKSLNVAMETQRTILRSMKGEQLMNANIYRDIADLGHITVESALEEFNIRSRIAQLARTMYELQASGSTLSETDVVFAHTKSVESKRLLEIHKEMDTINKQILQTDERRLKAFLTHKSGASELVNLMRAEAEMQARLTPVELQKMGADLDRERLELKREFAEQARIENQLALQRYNLEVKEYKYGSDQRIKTKNQMAELYALSYEITQEEAKQIMGARRKFDLREKIVESYFLEKELAMWMFNNDTSGYEETMQKYVLSTMMNQVLADEVEFQTMLNKLSAEESAILARVVPQNLVYSELKEHEVRIIQSMIAVMQTQQDMTENEITLLYQAALAADNHSTSMSATGIVAGNLTLQMMKLNGALSITAGIITLFDDSTQGAKVSMMLMTPVMLITTAQTVKMSIATAKNALSQNQASAGATSHAISLQVLKASAQSAIVTLKGLALTIGLWTAGISLAIGALYYLTSAEEDVTLGTIKMNGALSGTVDILQELQGMSPAQALNSIPYVLEEAFSEAGVDVAELMTSVEGLNELMGITNEKYNEYIELGKEGKTTQEQIYLQAAKDLEKYNAALDAQKTLLMANAVLAGDTAMAQSMAVESALNNAKSAVKQFREDPDIKKAREDINLRFGTIAFGEGEIQEHKGAAREVLGAVVAAYEQEFGAMNIDETEDFLEKLRDYSVKGTGTQILSNAFGDTEEFANSIGLTRNEIQDLFHALDDFNDLETTTVRAIQDVVDTLDFEMNAEQAQLIVDAFGDLENSADSAAEGMANAMGVLKDTFEGFASGREAMFYGFSQAAMTGDLVKQVKNQGVENLYANTELVITNNFNGMNLPEMVQTVTDGVVERLVALGVVNEGAVELA